jgi:coenzyme F420 hydrogenase subunit beta
LELKLKKGPEDLESRVLKKDFCCSCGACIGLCPYLMEMKENVVLFERCGLKEGLCYEVCPRTAVDMDVINQSVFGKDRDNFILGAHSNVLMSQSKDEKVRDKGQYGGTVSAVLMHGLESGDFDGVLLSGMSEQYGLLPEPVLAKSPEDILKASGSKYTACPTLSILDKSLKECDKLAVVGRPCQVTALRKRIICEPEIGEKISLVIGLFCMWALNYKKLSSYLSNKIEMDKAKKVDIPYNRFVVYTDNEQKELEFEKVKELRNPACDLCYDFTSEFADISVGSTEWKQDWNTLIIRTEKGEKTIKDATSKEKLETAPLPEKRVDLLKKAALGKKKRVLQGLSENNSAISDYLIIKDEEKEAIQKA